MTMKKYDWELVQKIRECIEKVAKDQIVKIILYGSRAMGTAEKDSDFDVLVVEKEPVSKLEEMRRLSEVLTDFPYHVDVWVMSEEEFEETKNVIGGLAYPANKYGVILQ